MGWSCRADAARTMERWDKACRESTGMSNVWKDGDDEFMYELSSKEHDDGAITGTIEKRVAGPASNPDGLYYKRAGTFRINGDGTIARAPAWLKDAGASFLVLP